MSPNGQDSNKKSKKNPYGDKFDNWFQYSKNNARDLITYILLVFGIILLFFYPVYGGLLIGFIAGVYYAGDIIRLIQNSESIIEKEGLVKSIVLGGTLLGLFISAPAIFIGIAIILGLRLFLSGESKK